jgi:hypothetical protein
VSEKRRCEKKSRDERQKQKRENKKKKDREKKRKRKGKWRESCSGVPEEWNRAKASCGATSKI